MALKIETVRDATQHDALIYLNDRTIAIERGPLRKTEKASKALLSDKVTAKHYKEGGRDAIGNTIKIGQPMTYVDWRNRKIETAFYVYQKETVKELDKHGVEIDVVRFMPRGNFETFDEALSHASGLDS